MMKTLWFAGTPGLYGNNNPYNGGGWIASLQREILSRYGHDLELSLVFPNAKDMYIRENNVDYYGITSVRHVFWRYKHKESAFCRKMKAIVDKVNPDVILCFGTENGMGLISCLTHIPVVIHLQGMLNPYYETWLPYGLTWLRYIMNSPQKIMEWYALTRILRKREMKMFQSCRFFLGRTEWDKNISRMLAPQSVYYYCGEVLRPEIYNSPKSWEPRNDAKKRIVSIISSAPYKGGDVILRAARLLKDYAPFDFVWEIYGIQEMKLWERLTGIKHDDVNVCVKGIVNSQQLVDVVTSADLYVHPSYIENSPNTVCEAQLLGIPLIATNVGGVSSLVKHQETGMLVPANHPYMMAATVQRLIEDRNLALSLSKAERTCALERHKPQQIASRLMEVFGQIITNKNQKTKR